jgi:outer membrane murein-binding lipoprotein Lpp
MVKIYFTMKRIYTLIVLLGIVMGTVLAGCENKSNENNSAGTNAPTTNEAPAAANTNK